MSDETLLRIVARNFAMQRDLENDPVWGVNASVINPFDPDYKSKREADNRRMEREREVLRNAQS